jgi:hypothetical protein
MFLRLGFWSSPMPALAARRILGEIADAPSGIANILFE